MRYPKALIIGVATCAATTGVQANETVTYSYDALGRLVASTTIGGPNSGVSTGTSFDPAGNRSGYSVSRGTASGGTVQAQTPRQSAARDQQAGAPTAGN